LDVHALPGVYGLQDSCGRREDGPRRKRRKAPNVKVRQGLEAVLGLNCGLIDVLKD